MMTQMSLPEHDREGVEEVDKRLWSMGRAKDRNAVSWGSKASSAALLETKNSGTAS